MAVRLLSLLAVLAVARAQNYGLQVLGHNKSADYFWAFNLPQGESPANLPDPLFVSSDSCNTTINAGVRYLDFDHCVGLCSEMPPCQVVAYYPVWVGANNGSACFGYGSVSNATRKAVGGSSPRAIDEVVKDKNITVYFGVKRPAENWRNFLWSNVNTSGNHTLINPVFLNPGACNDTDQGITDLTRDQCINVCLLLRDCMLVKYIKANEKEKTPSQCFAYSTVPPWLIDNFNNPTTLTDTIAAYDAGETSYLGVSMLYFAA